MTYWVTTWIFGDHVYIEKLFLTLIISCPILYCTLMFAQVFQHLDSAHFK
jgi:hypothetical protein